MQGEILDLHRQLRTSCQRLADQLPGPVVILYDRAELDTEAYAGPQLFQQLLQERHLTRGQLLSAYDAVLHLQSVAELDGAQHHDRDNPARWDDAEHARRSGQQILRSWQGVEHLWCIAAQPQLQDKLDRLLQVTLHLLGLPQPAEYETKWLLTQPPAREELHARGAVAVDLEQHYLPAAAGEARVRRRTVAGWSTYTHTTKQQQADGGRQERERRLSATEYHQLLTAHGPGLACLRKTRWCWAEAGQYWELDALQLGGGDHWLLEAEVTGPQECVTPPTWLGALQEVTGQPRWSSAALARSS